MKYTCKVCGKPLAMDDEGLNRKLISRDCSSFLCTACLAVAMGTTVSRLEAAALRFRKQGCHLFRPYDEGDDGNDGNDGNGEGGGKNEAFYSNF